MKKLLVVLVIMLVCATVIIGCGTPATPAPATPTTTKGALIPAAPAPAVPAPAAPAPAAPAPAVPAPTTPTAPLTPRYGGTLRIIEPGGPGTPIGWPAESLGGSVLSMQLSLQFLLKEMLGGKLMPNLAESFDVNTSQDAPSITFKLRKGVKFHDGTPFNAQAVKWNYDGVAKKNLYPTVSRYWKSIEAVDNYTLRINLNSPYQNRMSRSYADSVAMIASPSAYDKGEEWFRWHMVGTGPFKQIEFVRDTYLKTVRNDDYWESGKPYLEQVHYLYVADEMTRQALFKSGGAEVMDAVNPRIASELQAAGFKIISQLGGANVLVPDSLNEDSPWSNIKVRQAAEYAIDKEAIVKAFGYGYWQSAYQLFSPASMAFDSSLPGRKYDPEKAKQLLKEAGYPNGFKSSIIVQAGLSMDVPQAVQANFKAVGIDVNFEVAEAAKYNQYLMGTWKNALFLNPLMEWANPNTGFNFFWAVPSSTFKSTAKPEGWADMVRTSSITPLADPEATKKLERAAYDFSMVIPLYYGVALWATAKNVQDSGFGTRGAGTWWEPQNCWLSK